MAARFGLVTELFQHTAARRRLPDSDDQYVGPACFNTQPPEGGCFFRRALGLFSEVSTHSRPKAAAPD